MSSYRRYADSPRDGSWCEINGGRLVSWKAVFKVYVGMTSIRTFWGYEVDVRQSTKVKL